MDKGNKKNKSGVMRTVTVFAIIAGAALLSGCLANEQSTYSEGFRLQDGDTLAPAQKEPFLPRHISARKLPDLSQNPPLDDYLVYAALNNPALEAAFYTWKAALEKIPQAGALPDPRFTYTNYLRSVETRVGPQRQKFGLSQTFPWFEKLRLREDIAAKEALAVQKRFEMQKLTLFYTVKKAYAEYYYLSRSIAITKENVDLVKFIQQIALTRYTTGVAEHADVIKAQVELGKLDDRLTMLEDLRGPVAARLNAALGRASDIPIPWPESLPVHKVHLSDAELAAWLKEHNPELASIQFDIDKAQDSVRLAGQEYFPDITLGLDYVDTGEAQMPGVADSGKDPVMAMIMINIPLWWDKYKAEEAEARYKLLGARKTFSDRTLALESELKMTVYGIRDARRKMNLYKDSLIPKAKQSFEVTLEAFKTGNKSFLDVLETQRVLLEFELSYERALADHMDHLARLEMMVGRELPSAGQAAENNDSNHTDDAHEEVMPPDS